MSRLRTHAPFSAKSWAVARPMPEEAPDMMTRFPVREGISARERLREVMLVLGVVVVCLSDGTFVVSWRCGCLGNTVAGIRYLYS